ncbi:MAG: dethiobiotin synthase [bacterium]|nr:dethiobiotin synthase [bacterium]
MSLRSLFVTGTDTGVGKTVVTALIGALLARRGLRVRAMKPVATGCEQSADGLVSPDAVFLAEKLGLDDPPDRICPVRFSAPLAPAAAARLAGGRVDLAACDAALAALAARADLLLVEGIGGLLVPLGEGRAAADLARRWRLPLLVVARPGLGTINHTALTVECARARGLPVAGVVFNAPTPPADDPSIATNAAWVEESCGVPVWGTVPFGGAPLSDGARWERLLEAADRALGAALDAFIR